MVKIPPADAFRAFTEALAKDTVEDLLIIADGSRRSRITEAETRSLDTGEMMLKRGFAALSEILGPLQNSNSQTADTAYWALYDVEHYGRVRHWISRSCRRDQDSRWPARGFEP